MCPQYIPPTMFTCERCGKQFGLKPWQLRGGRAARYCSSECYHGGRRKSNAVRIEGGIAYIDVGNSLEAMVDVADVPLVERYTWSAMSRERVHTWYVHASRRRPPAGEPKSLMLHRLITNAPKGMVVDHINHNGLDNRRENLRVVTHRVNQRNRRDDHLRNTTGYRGVSVQKTRPSGQMYAAKVSLTRYFRYTEEGLEEAGREAALLREFIDGYEEWRAQHQD